MKRASETAIRIRFPRPDKLVKTKKRLETQTLLGLTPRCAKLSAIIVSAHKPIIFVIINE